MVIALEQIQAIGLFDCDKQLIGIIATLPLN
jgi:hypothetical protein